MKEAFELASLIRHGEIKVATAFLESVSEKISCREYKNALENVIIIKAAEILNSQVESFFVDTQKLAESLFGDDLSARTGISFLNEEMRKANTEDRKRSFLKAKSMIDSSFSEEQFSLAAVASYIGMSQSALTKLFLEERGEIPAQYVTRLRVKKGEELLTSGKTVNEAAGETGFSSAEAFIRAFKRINGVTPGQWKRNKLFL